MYTFYKFKIVYKQDDKCLWYIYLTYILHKHLVCHFAYTHDYKFIARINFGFIFYIICGAYNIFNGHIIQPNNELMLDYSRGLILQIRICGFW